MKKGFGENKIKIHNKNNFINYQKIIEEAYLYQKQGNIIQAKKLYKKLFNLKIKNPLLYFYYGSFLEKLNNLEEAAMIYLKAIEIFPKDFNFYNCLGLLKKKEGNFKYSEKLFIQSIKLNVKFELGYVNLGNLYSSIGKLYQAEDIYRKVLSFNSNSELGNLNLGTLLTSKGFLKEAEELFLNVIEINPKSAEAFFSLSKFKNINTNLIFKNKLFSEDVLSDQNLFGRVNIYFARANILHLEKKYMESAKNLFLANSHKLEIRKSDSKKRIDYSNSLFQKYSVNKTKNIIDKKKSNYIFIVGMPRSGSTLLESIISINDDVIALGESEALNLSYNEWLFNDKKKSFIDFYNKNIKIALSEKSIITDKNLSNFQYSPVILNEIKGSKIIHCFRNPLDNILSIFRSNFRNGFSYSSSLIDTAYVYVNQSMLMAKYKKLYKDNIYSINYDLLVTNPEKEIKDLAKWLDFDWKEDYLSPHLNKRAVETTSRIQVRSPINALSINSWKNYQEMLTEVIDWFEEINFEY